MLADFLATMIRVSVEEDIASCVCQTPLYSFDDARAGSGTDEV